MSNDPFTFDMFGGSALSSGLGLGVTAFGGFSPDPANDDDPIPLRPHRPLPSPSLLHLLGEQGLGQTSILMVTARWVPPGRIAPAPMSQRSSSPTALPSGTGPRRQRNRRS